MCSFGESGLAGFSNGGSAAAGENGASGAGVGTCAVRKGLGGDGIGGAPLEVRAGSGPSSAEVATTAGSKERASGESLSELRWPFSRAGPEA